MRDTNLDARREADGTIGLLRDTAARHMRTEAAREGLIVLEATYAPRECTAETRGLAYDVAVPLQARVHRSQLSVPGGRSKVRAASCRSPGPF
jgi:DnaJ family protein C protein 11